MPATDRPPAPGEPKMENQLRLIKKYPNRRLYDTKTSSYITLADVKQMVHKQEEFQVVDAKSGDDLTRAILLQIILDEEAGGKPMFSSAVLSNIRRDTHPLRRTARPAPALAIRGRGHPLDAGRGPARHAASAASF